MTDKNLEKENKDTKPLIDCVWGVICSLSSTDQDSKNISLFNLIDQFNIPQEFFEEQKKQGKSLIFRLQHELILFFRRKIRTEISNAEMLTDIRIQIIDPQGIILEEKFIPFKFVTGKRNIRLRIPKIGVMASMAGDYVYKIDIKIPEESDFEKGIEIPFEVKELLPKKSVQ